MSDLVIRPDQHLDIPAGTEPATAQLVQWAQAADAAGRFATVVCNTSAVPQAYRGKPAEAAAAILAGAEVGLSPMASLRAFDSIQGTPAPKAITLRAIAQGKGHDIRVEKSTPTEAVVSGLRAGDSEDKRQFSTWTIDRAQQMGLTGKQQWKQQPAAMLVARATAEVARWIASDAIMGMPYTAEELRDHHAEQIDRPRARLITAADILGPTDEPPADEPTSTTDPIDPMGTGWTQAPLTAADILAEIAQATSQYRLDEIKALCQAEGIRDPQILDAWTARSAQLVEG